MNPGLFLAIGMALGAAATHAGTEPLRHYGAALIGDAGAEAAFSARFNAQGRPIFLIADLGKGVAIGDIIRFKNKVVLIDEEVWQTMKATGVLADIRDAPVIELSARSSSGIWKSRAQLAEGREKIAYTLGAEFITVLEEYFGSIPHEMELAFRFDGNKMTILAPTEMLGALNFISRSDKGKKSASPERSQPAIISEPPRRAFAGEPMAWTVWAVDPGYPSHDIRYSLESRPPPGLSFDEVRHALAGKPQKAGHWDVKVKAVNGDNRSDVISFTLQVSANQRPRIWGEPERDPGADGLWKFQPHVSDPDHLLSELKVEPAALPDGFTFDPASHTFAAREKGRVPSDSMNFGLKVSDPLGASDQRTFSLSAAGGLRFQSALSASTVLQGESFGYAPVAVGPGRNIRYAADPGGPGRDAGLDTRPGSYESPALVDGRIPLATRTPGSYLLEVTAEDELGNRARQMISYQVLPRETLLQNLALASSHLGGTAISEARYRLGRARFGLLHPGLEASSMPFLFVGFEPIPAAAAGRRHSLFLDMGFNAQGRSGVTFGGLLLRLDGQYNRFGEDPLVFQYSAHYHARQGIVLFNPREFEENDLGDSKLESCLQELRARADGADSLVTDFLKCHDGADRIMDAYGSGANEIFFLEFALWLNLGISTGAGPIYWLEDHFHARGNFEQRLGAGLIHRSAFGWFGLDASVKLGFANAPAPLARLLFDLSMHFGRPD